MAAPKENKNGEKWTLERAEDFAQQVLDYIIEHDDCCSMSKACTELGQYESVIQYLENRFNVEFKPIKISLDILKSRLIQKGLYNKVNPTMAIFVLKNAHNMSDKVEQKTDLTTGGQSFSLKDMVKFE